MAAAATAILAADLTARAADAPAWVGRNALEIGWLAAITQLVTNTVGTLVGGDASAAGFDRRALVSRRHDLLWKAGSAATDWYVVLDQGASPPSIDTIIIDGHNFSGATVTVFADDAATPAVPYTGATALWTLSPADNSLIVNLQAASSYSPRYIQIQLHKAAPWTPQAAQIWVGKAIQWPVNALMITDALVKKRGKVIRQIGENDVMTSYKIGKSIHERVTKWRVSQGTGGVFFTALEDLFTNANALDDGTKCFWDIDMPTSQPSANTRLMYLTDPSYAPVWRSSSVTEIAFARAEQGFG